MRRLKTSITAAGRRYGFAINGFAINGFAVIAVLLMVFPTYPVRAQEEERQPVLPDLAPREVEIRGQLQIAFPSLQRQPLVGFNPPPRVPEIPLSRPPILEDYADAGASFLRASLNPPEPPAVTALTGEGPLSAEVEVSAGRYFQRRVLAAGAARFRSNQKVDIRVDYVGSDGEVMRTTPEDVRNRSDDFTGSLAYQKSTAAVRFGARLEGVASSYSLYGLDTTGTNGRIALNPDRTVQSAGESIWISSTPGQSVEYRIDAGLEQARVESKLFETGNITDPGTRRDERRGSFRALLAFPVGSAKGFLSGSIESAGLDSDGVVGSDVRHGRAAAGFSYEGPTLTFEGAPALLAVSFDGAVGGGTPGEEKTASYLSPLFNLRLRTGERVVFFARNDPHVEANSMASLFTRNAYLVTEPLIQPSIYTIDAEAGIALFSGPIQIKAEAAVRRSPNWGYFVESTGSGASSVNSGFFDMKYSDGRIISIGGEMSLSLPAELQLSAAAHYHDSQLTDLNVRIPNEPRLSGRAGLSYPFDSNRGLIQVTGRFIGSRFADEMEAVELDPYLDLDLYTRYNVSRSVAVVVRLDNMGPADNAIWSGYNESRFILSGGVRLLW